MPDNRFFYPGPFEARVILEGEEQHHMAKVMRRKEGDMVELVNGRGTLARGRIESLTRNKAHLLVEEMTQAPSPTRQLILAQALPKTPRLDLIIEKGTELGATAFWLFPGERSEKKSLSDSQLQSLQKRAISVLKQSGRLYLPTIELKPPLAEWKKPSIRFFYGDPEGSKLKPIPESIIFLVGPEKGLSEKEQALLNERLRAEGVSLNPNILRTETAGLCALSILACASL